MTIGEQQAKKGFGLVPFPPGADLAKHDAVRLAADGMGDAPRLGRDTLDPCHVFLFNSALLHGAGEKGAAVGIFGDSQSAARFSVQTADGAKHEGAPPVQKGQGVGQGILSVTVRGMGGHSRRLVAHHKALVLVKDGDGEGNGGQVGIGRLRLVLHGKGQAVSLMENGSYRYTLPV